MERYANYSGYSNVAYYSIGYDYIDIEFKNGKEYRYSYISAGRYNVERMKDLARCGRGLNSFIMNYCRYNYER